MKYRLARTNFGYRVTSLIELSKLRLPLVIGALVKGIEGISMPPPAGVPSDRLIPLNVIQTNLFFIQLISVCMQQHWLYFDSTSTQYDNNNCQLIDPPPLESSLAKNALNVTLRFMYHSSDPSKERATFFVHRMCCHSDAGFTKGDWSNFTVFMSHLHSSNIMTKVYEATCRVIFYISASNWGLIFSKIKSYILHLSTTSEENPDTLMLQLLECSSLNAKRLSMVLAELQLSFLHFKKNTQLNLAVLLRRGIWNWLEAYPTEFEDLQAGHRRLEGSPETLFDMCNSLADTTRKKTYLWPLQNMLLILCPDILMNLTMNLSSANVSKKGQFLNALKTAIQGDHMSEISVICYTDICLAAHKISKEGGSALWNLVPDVIEDLQSWISNPTKPYTRGTDLVNAGVLLDGKMLMRDADFALIQLSTKYIANSHTVITSNEDRSLEMKASRLKVGVLVETKIVDKTVVPSEEKIYMATSTKELFFRLTRLHQDRINSINTKGIKGAKATNIPNITKSKHTTNRPLVFHGSSNKNRDDVNHLDIDDMIHDIMVILKGNPSYLLTCAGCINNPKEVYNIITTITTYLNDPVPILADEASSCLYALHQPDIILLWDKTERFFVTYWEISSQVLLLVSEYILNHRRRKGLGLKRLMNLLKQLLDSQLDFLNSHRNALPTESNAKLWSQTSAALEMTLLVLLCSTDDFIYARVTDCIGILCKEYRIVENIGDLQLLRCTIFDNMDAYMDLVQRTDIVPGGRKMHQKRLCDVLRQIKKCTAGNLAAWEEVWIRWSRITSKITGEDALLKDDTDTNTGPSGKTESWRNSGGGHSAISLPTFKLHVDSSTTNYNKHSSLAFSESSAGNDEPNVEWEYYTGFLSSLAHVCFDANEDEYQARTDSPNYSKFHQDYRMFSTSFTAGPLSGQSRHYEGSYSAKSKEALVDRFVGKMVALLVCDNLRVRERIREIMGGDMTSSLYWTMIHHFKLYMNACFCQKTPIYDSRRILFVDQSLSVLRIMLSRSESADVLALVDFSELISQYCTYIDALDDNDTSKKIKIKLCQFCRALLTKRNQYCLHKDLAVRALLLKCFYKWTSDFDLNSPDTLWHKPQPSLGSQQSARNQSQEPPKKSQQLSQPQSTPPQSQSLSQQQQQQQSPALEQHPFHQNGEHLQQASRYQEQWYDNESQRTYRHFDHQHSDTQDQQYTGQQNEGTPHADNQDQQRRLSKAVLLESDLQIDLDMACLKTMVVVLHQLPLQPTEPTHEVDLIQRKSKVFYKYFSFFLQLLDRCKASEAEAAKNPGTSTASAICSNVGPFKDSIILCLSNILSANVDVGLKYSLSMGYHPDIQTRSAFMQVLTNILKQGTEFETLAESATADRYNKLVGLLLQYDYVVPMSLCDVCLPSDIDNVATALLASFASKKKSMVLLRLLIENEVQNTVSEGDLFRKTSIATKCLTQFAKANGTDYIVSVLRPVVNELLRRPPCEQTYELNPTNTGTGYGSKNKDNVISTTKLILDAICNSAFLAPESIRFACNLVLEAVKTRFPESKYTAVASFIFLRFFCPVIVSPESADLVEPGDISKDLRRGLLIIAKVVQNIANNVLFGSKEVYMVVLNDFVTENMYRVTTFLSNMSAPDTDSNDTPTGVSPSMNDTEHRLLHNILSRNFESIRHDLDTKKLLMFDNLESMTTWNNYIDELAMLITELGPPSESTKPLEYLNLHQRYIHNDNDRRYTEFMRKHNNLYINTITLNNIFYANGNALAGQCVVYFVLRRMQAKTIDMDYLMFHVFRVIENLYGRPFVLVLDATQFKPMNEIPQQRLVQFCDLVPKSMVSNMVLVLIVNPSTWFRKYIKNTDFPSIHNIIKRITFTISLKELDSYISPSETHLPKSTVALEREPSTVFFPVSRVWKDNTQIYVKIKIGIEYVQIISKKKQEMVFGASALTNDVYHISEIQATAGSGNHGDQANQVSFVSSADRTFITLRSSKSDQLLQTLLHCKKRYDASRPATNSDRIIRPSDVPGRMLNMALLNLGSCDSGLRQTAYNLLYTLCRTFKINVGTNLLDVKDLCLPPNCVKFVAKISGRLAITEQHLTLEFLSECFVGFEKATEDQRYLCLYYMTPWIPNLGRTSSGSPKEVSRTKEVLRMLIGISLQNIHTSIQTKLWKTLGTVDSVRDMALEASIQISKEHGLGSPQAEAMADTCVTLSNVLVRSKLVANTLRLLQQTTSNPTQILSDHPLWPDIAIMTRFNLMLSFDNRGPTKNYVPDILHIVTMLVGVGPTLIRTTVHGLVVNLIQSLSIAPKLPDDNRRELQQLMGETGDKRTQLMFGLMKPYANAFTISPDTLMDPLTEPFDLPILHTIITRLLKILGIGALTTDIANAWRSRWMGHVCSIVFQPNPAIQPRAFVALGCLGRQKVSDDILHHILSTLQHTLLDFDPGNPTLLLSITMCLRNVVENVDSDSRYLVPLFWVALAILSIGHPSLVCQATELLQGVLQCMNSHHLFDKGEAAMKKILVDTRESHGDVSYELDKLNGVNFQSHFSFSVAGILMKGWGTSQGKDAAYQCLLTFLNCATRHAKDAVEDTVLGYVACLISVAWQAQLGQDVLRFAGVHWENRGCTAQNDNHDYPCRFGVNERGDGNKGETTKATANPSQSSETASLFNKLGISDDDTALLFLSCLVAQLKNVRNEAEEIFLYELLSDAAAIIPDVFCIVYPTMLPQLDQLIISSNSVSLLNAIQPILTAAYSDSRFQYPKTTLQHKLASLGFSLLEDPSAPVSSSHMVKISSLTALIVKSILQ